jgi:acyl-CoA synthetase (NDP forming)
MSNRLAQDLVDVAATTDKPICVIWGSPVGDEDAYRQVLLGSRVPVFRTFSNCVHAVKAWLDYHAFADRYRSPFAKPVLRPSAAAKDARVALEQAGPRLLEREAKDLLRAYGIPVTSDVVATTAREAVRAAETIGYPVVLKASGDFPHKSDRGLVRVGVPTAKAVRDAYAEIIDRAGGDAEGVLVCEMVTGGVETVVGVTHDSLFGPTVMFGLGGVFVEVLGDVTFRVPPFDAAEARRMVQEVQAWPLLTGVRGTRPADVKALVDVIMRVQRLAVDLHADIAELDVNPLVVRERGAVALDALAVRH